MTYLIDTTTNRSYRACIRMVNIIESRLDLFAYSNEWVERRHNITVTIFSIFENQCFLPMTFTSFYLQLRRDFSPSWWGRSHSSMSCIKSLMVFHFFAFHPMESILRLSCRTYLLNFNMLQCPEDTSNSLLCQSGETQNEGRFHSRILCIRSKLLLAYGEGIVNWKQNQIVPAISIIYTYIYQLHWVFWPNKNAWFNRKNRTVNINRPMMLYIYTLHCVLYSAGPNLTDGSEVARSQSSGLHWFVAWSTLKSATILHRNQLPFEIGNGMGIVVVCPLLSAVDIIRLYNEHPKYRHSFDGHRISLSVSVTVYQLQSHNS